MNFFPNLQTKEAKDIFYRLERDLKNWDYTCFRELQKLLDSNLKDVLQNPIKNREEVDTILELIEEAEKVLKAREEVSLKLTNIIAGIKDE